MSFSEVFELQIAQPVCFLSTEVIPSSQGEMFSSQSSTPDLLSTSHLIPILQPSQSVSETEAEPSQQPRWVLCFIPGLAWDDRIGSYFLLFCVRFESDIVCCSGSEMSFFLLSKVMEI